MAGIELTCSYFTLTGAGSTEPPAFPLADRFAAMSAAGFTGAGLHFAEWPVLAEPDVRQAFDRSGLAVTEIEFLWQWAYAADDAGRSAASVEVEDTLVEMATALRPRQVHVGEIDVAHGFDTCGGFDAVAERFGRICDRFAAAAPTTNVLIEFLPWSDLSDVATAARLVERAGRPNGGVLVDAWHFVHSGSTLADLRAVDPSIPLALQLDDGYTERVADPGEMMAATSQRLLPGLGEFELRSLIDTVRELRSDVSVSVEIFSEDLRHLPLADAAVAVYEATIAVLRP